MGLLGTTTAEQYYNSSQKFTATASQTVFELTVSNPPSSIDDFIVLDSDLVFFKDIKLKNDSMGRYNYAYSSQWHASYRATMRLILGIEHTPGPYYSGICHHMVMVKKVIDDMKDRVISLHGIPLWQMMLNASARETTCRAPRGEL